MLSNWLEVKRSHRIQMRALKQVDKANHLFPKETIVVYRDYKELFKQYRIPLSPRHTGSFQQTLVGQLNNNNCHFQQRTDLYLWHR